MSERMKIWTIDRLGADRLTLGDAPIPTPGPGEVLVRTRAISLNYRDKLVLENGMGMQLKFPFTPISDLAGEVAAMGDGVTRFSAGDRVISTFIPHWIDGQPFGNAAAPGYPTLGGKYPGVAAEYVVLSEQALTAAPKTMTDAEASTVPVAGVTAWFALVEEGHLAPGQTVLLQGTGGVSLYGVQIAKAAGARAIITSSDPAKLERAKALGADHGIDRRAGDWAQAAIDLTGGRGVDHVLEVAGGASFGQSLTAVAVRGRIAVIGLLDSETLTGSVYPLLLKQVGVRGVVVGHRRAQEDFVRFADAHALKPVIDQVYDFAALPAALAHLDRGPFGKIVLTV